MTTHYVFGFNTYFRCLLRNENKTEKTFSPKLPDKTAKDMLSNTLHGCQIELCSKILRWDEHRKMWRQSDKKKWPEVFSRASADFVRQLINLCPVYHLF